MVADSLACRCPDMAAYREQLAEREREKAAKEQRYMGAAKTSICPDCGAALVDLKGKPHLFTADLWRMCHCEAAEGRKQTEWDVERAEADALASQRAAEVKADKERREAERLASAPVYKIRVSAEQRREQRQGAIDDRWLTVKEQEITNREARLRAGPDTADGLTVKPTLDSLAAVFGDDVDLSETPALLQIGANGPMVLPAGKLNWIYGLPGCGKSFLCEICLIEAVMRGGRALYLDYEDSAKTFHQRAAILGFNPKAYADSFKYIHGGLADYPDVQAEAMEWLAGSVDPEMNVVIIDAAESSGCPSDGAPVNEWLEKVVFPWRTPDAQNGVVVSDHIPKTKDNRPDGPIGSQRKLAATDGINLLVGGYCWSKKKGGRITLTNDKDRTGTYGKKEPVATIIGEWEGQGDTRTFSHRIVEPSREDSANNNVGGAILNEIAAAGPTGFAGKNKLYQAVGGNRNAVFSTIDNLTEGGLVAIKKDKSTDVYTLTEEGRAFVG